MFLASTAHFWMRLPPAKAKHQTALPISLVKASMFSTASMPPPVRTGRHFRKTTRRKVLQQRMRQIHQTASYTTRLSRARADTCGTWSRAVIATTARSFGSPTLVLLFPMRSGSAYCWRGLPTVHPSRVRTGLGSHPSWSGLMQMWPTRLRGLRGDGGVGEVDDANAPGGGRWEDCWKV